MELGEVNMFWKFLKNYTNRIIHDEGGFIWALLSGIGKAVAAGAKVAGAAGKGLAAGAMKGSALTSSPLALAGKGANLAATAMKVGSQVGALGNKLVMAQLASTGLGNVMNPQNTTQNNMQPTNNQTTDVIAPPLPTGIQNQTIAPSPLAQSMQMDPMQLEEIMRQQRMRQSYGGNYA